MPAADAQLLEAWDLQQQGKQMSHAAFHTSLEKRCA
jgi:hypothetical protein